MRDFILILGSCFAVFIIILGLPFLLGGASRVFWTMFRLGWKFMKPGWET